MNNFLTLFIYRRCKDTTFFGIQSKGTAFFLSADGIMFQKREFMFRRKQKSGMGNILTCFRNILSPPFGIIILHLQPDIKNKFANNIQLTISVYAKKQF